MPLTGKDVWDAIVKVGFLSGPYDPRKNRHCSNADVLARLLNEVLSKRHNWLPNLLETEDAMRLWEASTPRELCRGSTSFSTSVAIPSWASTLRLNAKQRGAQPLPLKPQPERRDKEFTGLSEGQPARDKCSR
jgi:hypothetical protein